MASLILSSDCGLGGRGHRTLPMPAIPHIEKGKTRRHIKTFGTTTKVLEELKDWFLELNVMHVAMESTGVYGVFTPISSL